MYIILGAGVLLYCRGHHKQNNRNNSSPNFLVGDGQPPDLCIIIPIRSPSCLPSALMVFHLFHLYPWRFRQLPFCKFEDDQTEPPRNLFTTYHPQPPRIVGTWTYISHPFHTHFTPISNLSLYIYITYIHTHTHTYIYISYRCISYINVYYTNIRIDIIQ